MKDKFRLDMNEEQAVQYLQNLIDESIKAFIPELMERFHKIAMVRGALNRIVMVRKEF